MKLPRDLSGRELIAKLFAFGYSVTRQTGSHVRLTHAENPVHHLTIPDHRSLSPGTLRAIVREVAKNLKVEPDEVIARLFED